MSPTSADECDDGMDMAFAFDTIRTDIICKMTVIVREQIIRFVKMDNV